MKIAATHARCLDDVVEGVFASAFDVAPIDGTSAIEVRAPVDYDVAPALLSRSMSHQLASRTASQYDGPLGRFQK